MKCEVHILCFNEAEILPYTIRHYSTFCDEITIHDGGSTDGSRVLARRLGATVKPWDTAGKLNDGLAAILKNTCWKGTDSNWVICVDADELVYFPGGAKEALESYEQCGAAVIRPEGFEMFSEVYPTGFGQIYDEVKTGARDEKWYAKPVLFSPARVLESGFGMGAHESEPILKNGNHLKVNQNWPHPDPRALLLHFHQIGPIERIAQRYDATRLRLSSLNERHRWGNFDPGLKHAKDKRGYIIPRLEQVIA